MTISPSGFSGFIARFESPSPALTERSCCSPVSFVDGWGSVPSDELLMKVLVAVNRGNTDDWNAAVTYFNQMNPSHVEPLLKLFLERAGDNLSTAIEQMKDQIFFDIDKAYQDYLSKSYGK